MKKSIHLTLTAVAVALLPACSSRQTPPVGQLLADQQRQDSIMQAICDDHGMMMNMMQHMRMSDHAMAMMAGDSTMMGHMMRGGGMMGMMRHDPAMMKDMMHDMMGAMAADSSTCMNMCGMMMGDEHMKGAMMDMCGKGMMGKEGKTETGTGMMHHHAH